MLDPEAVAAWAQASVRAEIATGCPAELSLAQWRLESGNGEHTPGNNGFGIKNTDRYPGSQYLWTTEHWDGKDVRVQQEFEVYPSIEECFKDHALLITANAVYQSAFSRFKQDRDLAGLVIRVAWRYATARDYAERVWEIITAPDMKAAIAAARTAHA